MSDICILVAPFFRNDIYKQMTNKAFAEKNIEHKRVVVDKEKSND